MDEIANPHDTYFRESFGRREVARDFLRVQLPADLLAEIDLDSLEIAKDTYVYSDLRPAFSDLVYRVRHGDRDLSIYLLFEHKAAPEYWVLLQLLRYISAEGTGRVDEPQVRKLLQQTPTGDPIMQTFIDRYIEQGREQGFAQGCQHGEAAVLLRQIELKFGPPSEAVAQRIQAADADTLLDWSERILTATSVDAVVH